MSFPWAAVAQGALQVGQAWLQSSAQHKANRTNIQLQREQQAWEAHMSNTAVQRRQADIVAAGGNPALAFTTGAEASTPSITPARVEPNKLDLINNFTALQMAKAQVDNIKADTRIKQVDADNAERFGRGESGLGALNWQKAWADVAAKQLEVKKKDIEVDLTASQLAKFNAMWPILLQTAKQQQQEGKINLEALESIASMGGVLETSKLQGLIALLLRLIRN